MSKIFLATLNSAGRSYADSLISSGKVNKTGAWTFSADDGNTLLGPNGNDWVNYGKHHLGVDGSEAENTKAHYKYPFAKGGTLYRSALTAIRQRAGQQHDTAVYDAAGALLEKIDGDSSQDSGARILQFRPRDSARPLNYRMEKKGTAAEIYLYDSVGGFFGISAKQFSKDLKALGNVKKIDLRINSDGGDVFEGRAIYTQLAQHPARIVARIDGIAASIASLVAMAADEIRMADGAFMMIHNAWAISVGNSTEMRRMADLLDSVDATIQETYAARTKNSISDVKQWMDAETWMPAQDAVDKGFADVKDEPVKIAACLHDPSRFRHVPAQILPKRAAAMTRIAALKRA